MHHGHFLISRLNIRIPLHLASRPPVSAIKHHTRCKLPLAAAHTTSPTLVCQHLPTVHASSTPVSRPLERAPLAGHLAAESSKDSYFTSHQGRIDNIEVGRRERRPPRANGEKCPPSVSAPPEAQSNLPTEASL